MLIDLEYLADWRASIPPDSTLVVTNGCFDILHLGHIDYLQKAKKLGHHLLVGINGDDSVRQLKGDSRPINSEVNRAKLVDALKSVDAVCIFKEKLASNFLRIADPDVYAKGGDYTPETLNKEEKAVIDTCRSKIVIIPFLRGFSTTETLSKIITST